MQRVSLFGYAKTTKSLAKLFSHATFYDDKCIKPFRDASGFMVKPSTEFNPDYSDLEITSPGIMPSHPLTMGAKNLISEYDYFADTKPFKIWISGTNGKTTTTQMVEHLLKSRGAISGGNIGTPLADLDQDASVWILETSSFTMHYTNKASPNCYILLPITPDHLSWHGSMQAYADAKLKPLQTMQEGEVAILPHCFKDVQTNAYTIYYENETDFAQTMGIDTSKLKFKGAFLMDTLLAMAIDKILFDTLDYEKMNSFVIEAHRQEELRDAKGRLWVNDTKATNLDATIAALKAYSNQTIHLILGGDDKGVDLTELFLFLQTVGNLKTYHIGSNKKRLTALACEYKIVHQECQNLFDAVMQINNNLAANEVALLSPAAASLDEFTSYAHRGNDFKAAIKALS